MELNDFHYGLSLLYTLYGITMPEEDYEEIALIGWNTIGNKRSKLYKYSTCINDCNTEVFLPCNCVELEAVTTDLEEWNNPTNDTPNGDIQSAYTESYIEHRKSFRQPLYLPGKLIRYELVGDRLYFDRPYGRINILYKGVVADENGLPRITDKEARALATFCAYNVKFKEGISTSNPNIINLANSLLTNWYTLCNLARVDHYMSQNEWDEVLDAKTSWNRKQYNKSLKIYH